MDKYIYRHVLPYLGPNQNFSLVLVCIPVKYFGLGLPHLYNGQVKEQILTFLRHRDAGNYVVHWIILQSEQDQIEIWMGLYFFSLDFKIFIILMTKFCLKSVCEFISNNDIDI